MLLIAIIIIMIGILVALFRLIKGKTVWNKLLSLNLLSAQSAMLIITYAVYKDIPLLMDIALAYSIIGFLSLILLARFIESGRRI